MPEYYIWIVQLRMLSLSHGIFTTVYILYNIITNTWKKKHTLKEKNEVIFLF